MASSGEGLFAGSEETDGEVVDLRSDTVTKPTAEMRNAMATAKVGDDGRGDDPIVKELESYAAGLFNKEAGLFCPSGTMGNLICVLCHCRERGSEVIVGDKSHLCLYEQGGISTLGGVHSRQLPNNPDGTIDPDRIAQAVRSDDPHYPVTRLICLENTHNHCGGRILSLEYMRKVGEIAKAAGVPIHIDGARIMNAATALGVTPAKITKHADSVSICLSKGLGAPIGAVIVGSQSFIKEARRMRKALGGQLRQVGVVAAPGLIALQRMPSHLKEDHRHALQLAKSLVTIRGLVVDIECVETNMVIVDVRALERSVEDVIYALQVRGIHSGSMEEGTLRLVTHHHISDQDIERTVKTFSEVVRHFEEAPIDSSFEGSGSRRNEHMNRKGSHGEFDPDFSRYSRGWIENCSPSPHHEYCPELGHVPRCDSSKRPKSSDEEDPPPYSPTVICRSVSPTNDPESQPEAQVYASP